jgi:hypothetical protein
MTASAPPPWSAPPPPPRRSWGAGRVVSLVLGILLLLPALGLLGGGGTLLWADWTQRENGFVVSPHESFASQGYALVSERIDLRTDADWLPISATLGTARVEVTGRGSQEVFVGIAPAADASAYLGSVQRTVIRDLGFDQPASQVDQRPGDAPSGPPGDQPFWSAQTSGPGTQALTWDPAAGEWMLVVMNADASAGVVVSARVGAEFPALTGLAWGLTIAGLVLTVVAVLLIVLPLRTPRPLAPSALAQYGAVPYPRPPAAAETRPAEPTVRPAEPGDRAP